MIRFMNKNLLSAALMSAAMMTATSGYAASLVVTDCQGATRAVEDITSGSSRTVELSMTDTEGAAVADGATLTLTNSSTGKKIIGSAKNGLISFDNVVAGTWTACPASQDAVLKKVALVSTPTLASDTTDGLILGTGIVGAGIAAVGFSRDSNNSVNSDGSTPLVGSTGSKGNESPTTAGAKGNSRPRARANDCLNDEEPTPISPFN